MQSDAAGSGSGAKRSSSRKKKTGGEKSLLRAPGTGKTVGLAMTAAAAAYLVAGAVTFYQQVGGYAGVPVGANPDEVEYFAGQPDAVRAEGGQWLFGGEGENRQIQFRDGRVVQISCAGLNCPTALGIRVGQPEQAVLAALGMPTGERVSRGRKIMRYSDIGYDVVLEHNVVQQIVAVDRGSGFFRAGARFLIWLLP
jgi:hypothetical protein